MQVWSLSSGSSGNCYLVRDENTLLLMDAGLSTRRVAHELTRLGAQHAGGDRYSGKSRALGSLVLSCRPRSALRGAYRCAVLAPGGLGLVADPPLSTNP